MASLQPYQSHGIKYYRIVESFRKEGKPHIRVLAHLGRVDDILELHRQQKEVPVKVSSVSAGAVTALHLLARKFDVAGISTVQLPRMAMCKFAMSERRSRQAAGWRPDGNVSGGRNGRDLTGL